MLLAQWKIFAKAFIVVFVRPRYFIMAVLVAILDYLLIIFIHQSKFILYVWSTDLFGLITKLKLTVGSFLSVETNFVSAQSFWLVILLALLIGINVAMLAYLLRRQAIVSKEAGMSLFGVIASVFGIGCAACGSVVLTSLFGIGVTTSIISFLPLAGVEFMIVALIVIIYSIYHVSKKIIDPMFCKPTKTSEVVK